MVRGVGARRRVQADRDRDISDRDRTRPYLPGQRATYATRDYKKSYVDYGFPIAHLDLDLRIFRGGERRRAGEGRFLSMTSRRRCSLTKTKAQVVKTFEKNYYAFKLGVKIDFGVGSRRLAY